MRGLGQKRRDKDLYETDTRLCSAIVTRVEWAVRPPSTGLASPRIIEPSAGSGNFVRACRDQWRDAIILAVDLHTENVSKLHRAGATSYVVGRWQEQDVAGFQADLIIGNPPFSEAEEHVQHALAVLPEGGHLAYLLPTTFITTQGRCERLWKKWPDTERGFGQLRYFWPLAERPSFTGDGQTDMTEYGVYVWRKGFTANPEILPAMWWRTEGR